MKSDRRTFSRGTHLRNFVCKVIVESFEGEARDGAILMFVNDG